MKKILIVAVIAIFAKVHAQVSIRPGMSAGLNFSKIQNTELKNKTDFYLSFYGALKLSKFYTLQPELSYSRQGGKGRVVTAYSSTFNGTSLIVDNEYKNADVSLQYISEITINKFNFNKNFYFLVGPFVDLLVSSKVTIENSNSKSTSKGEDIDFGIVGGLGYSMSKNGLSLEGRIKTGNRNAIETQNAYNGIDVNKNLVFQIGATYTFNKK